MDRKWYHVCWPRLTAKRVEPVVSISWASCFMYSVGRYLFCELCLSWHSVHHSLLPVQKCNNVGLRHAYELPDTWPLNSPDPIQLTTKSGATSLPDKSAGCEWFEATFDWCVSWSGTERYWPWHWAVAHSSSMPAFQPQEDILNIHLIIYISQNIKKRKLKFIVKRDICFRF